MYRDVAFHGQYLAAFEGERIVAVTGCSAGGLHAGCMGALRSSYIAATAPNSGGEISQLTIQDPTRAPAVVTMHGGDSDKVVVSFATTSASYDAQMKAAGSFVVNCNHGGGHCGAPAELQTAAWTFIKAHPFGVAPNPTPPPCPRHSQRIAPRNDGSTMPQLEAHRV